MFGQVGVAGDHRLGGPDRGPEPAQPLAAVRSPWPRTSRACQTASSKSYQQSAESAGGRHADLRPGQELALEDDGVRPANRAGQCQPGPTILRERVEFERMAGGPPIRLERPQAVPGSRRGPAIRPGRPGARAVAPPVTAAGSAARSISRFASAFLSACALVVHLLPAGHRDLDFRPAVPEIDAGRDEGEAALGRLAGELGQLPPVDQELAVPLRLVVEPVAHRVLGDLAADQPEFAVVDLGVGPVQGAVPVPQALDLGPDQDDPALEPVGQLVLVGRPPVPGDHLDVVAPCPPWPSPALPRCPASPSLPTTTRPRTGTCSWSPGPPFVLAASGPARRRVPPSRPSRGRPPARSTWTTRAPFRRTRER